MVLIIKMLPSATHFFRAHWQDHSIGYKDIPHSEFFVAVYVLLFLIELALLSL